MTVRCPVCRRPIEVNRNSGRVWKHRDTVGHSCPMGGRHINPKEIAA